MSLVVQYDLTTKVLGRLSKTKVSGMYLGQRTEPCFGLGGGGGVWNGPPKI